MFALYHMSLIELLQKSRDRKKNKTFQIGSRSMIWSQTSYCILFYKDAVVYSKFAESKPQISCFERLPKQPPSDLTNSNKTSVNENQLDCQWASVVGGGGTKGGSTEANMRRGGPNTASEHGRVTRGSPGQTFGKASPPPREPSGEFRHAE